MGFLSRKTKTTVETNTTKTALTKIVKFSYLQTLAIDGGLGDVREIAGEESASEQEFNDSEVDESRVEEFAKKNDELLRSVGNLFDGTILGGIASGLFGM